MGDVSTWQAVMSVGIGLGLAAAAGFRVFVPLLVLSVAARAGYLPLSAGFEWIGTTPALLAFATATVLEVAAYYVPWLDNALDAIAAPTAVVAGVLASASVMTDLPPLVKWSVAIVGGGLAAGVVAGSTSLVRLKSTATTAGLANPVVATTELAGALVTSLLALVLPLVVLLFVGAVILVLWRLRRRASARQAPPPAPA